MSLADIPAQVRDVGMMARADGRSSEEINANPGTHSVSHDLRLERSWVVHC